MGGRLCFGVCRQMLSVDGFFNFVGCVGNFVFGSLLVFAHLVVNAVFDFRGLFPDIVFEFGRLFMHVVFEFRSLFVYIVLDFRRFVVDFRFHIVVTATAVGSLGCSVVFVRAARIVVAAAA